MFIACQHQLCSASVHVHLVLLGTDSNEFSPHFPPGSFEQTTDLSFGAITCSQLRSVWQRLVRPSEEDYSLFWPWGATHPCSKDPEQPKEKKKKGEWKGSHAKDKWTEEGIQTIEFPCCNLFWNKTVVVVTQGYAWGRIAQSYARTHIYRCQKTDDIWIRSVVW